MRAAVRQTRPKERLVRRRKAEAPAGFNRPRQWRLQTIRLVLLASLAVTSDADRGMPIAPHRVPAGSSCFLHHAHCHLFSTSRDRSLHHVRLHA